MTIQMPITFVSKIGYRYCCNFVLYVCCGNTCDSNPYIYIDLRHTHKLRCGRVLGCFKIGFLREYGISSDNTCGEPAALCLASCYSCTHIEERVSCTSLLHLNSIGCIRVMRKYVGYAHVFLLV